MEELGAGGGGERASILRCKMQIKAKVFLAIGIKIGIPEAKLVLRRERESVCV